MKINVSIECQQCKNYNTIEINLKEEETSHHIICYNCDSNINVDIYSLP